jgi:Ca2+-binding RTX toxin-like protein
MEQGMTVHIISASQVGAGIQVTLGTDDRLFVAEGATLGRTDGVNWGSFAVSGNGNGQILDIHGSVVSDGTAINLGDDNNGGDNTLMIHETGMVRGYRPDASGVRMLGSDLTLENAGTILGSSHAVVMDAHEAGRVSAIVNEGTIRSTGDTGIYVYTTALGIVELHNSGRVVGAVASYQNSAGTPVVDRIFNEGIMKGSVLLGAGDDLYDGRKGMVQGTVDGGIGDDVLRGGKGAETLVGGSDADMLYGGAGRDVFQFNDETDSAAKERDMIKDFSHAQKDRIDFVALDGNFAIKLDFIGDDKFSKEEGEVRFQQMKGFTQVQVDLDGDGKADFALDVSGRHDFAGSDFLL